MNKKLFKPLNEQLELNQSVNREITEAEKVEVEKKLIFEDLTAEIREDINLCEGRTPGDPGAGAAWKWGSKPKNQYSVINVSNKKFPNDPDKNYSTIQKGNGKTYKVPTDQVANLNDPANHANIHKLARQASKTQK